MRTLLLPACCVMFLLLNVSIVQSEEPEQANPLEPFARAVGGIWVDAAEADNEGGSYTKSQSEWGIEGRTIRSRVWQVRDGKQTQIMEGGIYWHPGRKLPVMWALDATGNVMEARLSNEDGVLISNWTYYAAGQVMEGRNHSRYPDADTLEIEEFMRRGGAMQKFRERRMIRKPADWCKAGPAAEATAQTPENMKLMEPHVGGDWAAVRDEPNQSGDTDFYRVEWGLGRQVAQIRTFKLNEGTASLTFEGAHFWHPGRKEVVFFQVGKDGILFEGVSSQHEDAQEAEWTAWHQGRETRARQTVRFYGADSSESEIFTLVGEEWELAARAKFVRKQTGWWQQSEE